MPRKSTNVARPLFFHRGRGLGLGKRLIKRGHHAGNFREAGLLFSQVNLLFQLNSLMLFNTYYSQICQHNVSRQSLTSGEHGLESVKNIVKLLII